MILDNPYKKDHLTPKEVSIHRLGTAALGISQFNQFDTQN